MAFNKSFPKTVEGINYPKWVEIKLSDQEEQIEKEKARQENIKIMKQCLDDAKLLFIEKDFKDYQTDIVSVARSSKEKYCCNSRRS